VPAKPVKSLFYPVWFLAGMALLSSTVYADGIVIDKVYHPYVDALENEIEYRSVFLDSGSSKFNIDELHQLSYGKSLGERFFSEVYLIGARTPTSGFDLEAWEIEVKWQLTEQGEYSADWGLFFEFEDELDKSVNEVTVGLLAEKELGRWSATANLNFIQEWGSAIKDEFETAVSLQARYRFSRAIEPALELYAGQDTLGLGPAFGGNLNLGIRKSLNWEAGIIMGLDDKTPDSTFRMLIEYEF